MTNPWPPHERERKDSCLEVNLRPGAHLRLGPPSSAPTPQHQRVKPLPRIRIDGLEKIGEHGALGIVPNIPASPTDGPKMGLPFSLTRSMAGYVMRRRWSGQRMFPLVLMLEPLHACNLKCVGCGRIREYAQTLRQSLSLDECLAADDECQAPVVSICGGEPLLYPPLEALIERLIDRGRHVYLCTNGTLLARRLATLPPSDRLFLNIHLDGMEQTHDAIAGRPGVFGQAIEGIRAAKKAGFRVCTNTTLYRQTDPHEIVVLFEYLTSLGVDGFLIAPAYGYEAVCRSGGDAIFLTRQEAHSRFRQLRPLLKRFRVWASPIYLDFLAGDRDLACAAWANPTRNLQGWKGPCYLITDAHYSSYRELLEQTHWEHLGPGRDPRCQNCLMHCGFEPAAVLAAQQRLGDAVRMAWHSLRG